MALWVKSLSIAEAERFFQAEIEAADTLEEVDAAVRAWVFRTAQEKYNDSRLHGL
jgi:hypothetical protein